MSLDTGYVDSGIDLGISAPPAHRIQLRELITCAPVPADEKYSVLANDTSRKGFPPVPARYYFMGPSSGAEGDYTYFANDLLRNYSATAYGLV